VTVDTSDRTLSTVYHFDDNAYMPIDSVAGHELSWLKYPAGCRIKISAIPAAIATTRADVSLKIVVIQD
jgi:hypothetical protein